MCNNIITLISWLKYTKEKQQKKKEKKSICSSSLVSWIFGKKHKTDLTLLGPNKIDMDNEGWPKFTPFCKICSICII